MKYQPSGGSSTLALLTVQIFAALALIATIVIFLIGRSRRPIPNEPVVVVAKGNPLPGTQVVWLAGVLLSVVWPFGVFFAPNYAYHWPAFPDLADSWVVQIVGVALSIASGVLFSAAARTLGRQMTPVIQVRKNHELIQVGPFRYIRHPVYTAIVMLAVGQSLFYLSLPVGLLALLLAGLATYRARLEENLLKSPNAFGAAYVEYMNRTGRFLPRLRSRS